MNSPRFVVTAIWLTILVSMSGGEVFSIYDGLKAKELEWVGSADGLQLALEAAPRITSNETTAFYILVRNSSSAAIKYVTPSSVGSTSNIWSAAIAKDGKLIKTLDWSDEFYSDVAAVMTMPSKAVHVFRVELSKKQFSGAEYPDATLRITYSQPALAAEVPVIVSVEQKLAKLRQTR